MTASAAVAGSGTTHLSPRFPCRSRDRDGIAQDQESEAPMVSVEDALGMHQERTPRGVPRRDRHAYEDSTARPRVHAELTAEVGPALSDGHVRWVRPVDGVRESSARRPPLHVMRLALGRSAEPSSHLPITFHEVTARRIYCIGSRCIEPS